ncbi:MAG TPA: hypothetical protein VEX86_12490 [Longimicrobium sp.]|nr:hypothetical protein [Longimicrobium sp.]
MTRLPAAVPAVLRVIVLALLVLALALPSLWRPESVAGRVVRIRSAGDLSNPAALLGGDAPAAIAYESPLAPSAAELETLAAAAERTPVFATAPRNVRSVDATATARPLAGRAAAVSFRVHGPAGDSARVFLTEAGAAVDSLTVRADGRGNASGAFRVRPAAEGWREWGVRAVWPRGDSAGATAGAWVDSAGPPRVLLRAGFPDWEAKFVVRALEESGARVETSMALGRGLAVEAGGGAISPARLARVDAAIVLDGAPLTNGEAAALAEWASRGGGVLLQGDRAGAAGFGMVRPAAADATVDGAAIRWSAPPELATLPRDRVAASARPFAAVGAVTSVAAEAPAGPLLAVRPLGRGRAAALAIGETWRWRMEAGRLAEHREFWRSLVDWLSSARPEPLAIRLADASGAVGTRREVRVYDARGEAGAPVPPLVITRPGGAADTVRLARDPAAPGVLRGSFVAAAPGLHALSVDGQPPAAGFRAVSPSPAESAESAVDADSWARLSLLAARSGGGILPPDSLRPALARFASSPAAPRGPSVALLFALLLIAAAAEWAIRRLTGRV